MVYLHNSAGARLAYVDYSRYVDMNIANRDYQRTWVKNVKADGFDGVYIDDVNT